MSVRGDSATGAGVKAICQLKALPPANYAPNPAPDAATDANLRGQYGLEGSSAGLGRQTDLTSALAAGNPPHTGGRVDLPARGLAGEQGFEP